MYFIMKYGRGTIEDWEGLSFDDTTDEAAEDHCGRDIEESWKKTTEEILEAGLEMEKIFLKKISPIYGKTGYFRVTPGLDEENERFVRFLKNYFG